MHDIRYTHLPFCLQRHRDGSYTIQNRYYAPLGFTKRPDDSITPRYRIPGLTAGMAERISFDGDRSLDKVYLYNDTCVPTQSTNYMTAYMERLAILSALEIEPVEASEAALFPTSA